MDVSKLIPRQKTRFVRVKCNSCGNEQTIFSAATSTVRCNVCNHELAKSGASRIKVKAKIVREFS